MALYEGERLRMSDEILESYLRQLIDAHRVPEVTVAWQGGEPTLMGLDFYRRAVAIEARYRKPGQTIQNTLQTNGTLLTDEWCAFFRENGFLVGVSLDGPPAMHDAYRPDRRGQPTADRVIAGIRLLQEHGVDYNILTTVNAANADHPLEVYRYLRDEIGAEFIQLIPIVEREGYRDGGQRAIGDRREVGHVPYRRIRRVGAPRRRNRLRPDVRCGARGLGRRSLGAVPVLGDLWGRAGARAQWRPVLLRPLRGS